MHPRVGRSHVLLGYVMAIVFASVVWTAGMALLEPDESWQRHAVEGAAFGVLMVVLAEARERWKGTSRHSA